MDKSKETNIKVNAILLEKLEFERQPGIPEEIMQSNANKEVVNLKIDTDIERRLTNNKKRLLVKLQLKISDEKNMLHILCRIVGIFTQKEEGSMNLEEFSKINAPTLLFPYIRENISNVTMKAGLPPLILPPLNMVKLLEKKY